jgi:flagellar biosynthesis/type III secretory pathway chaperone
MTALADVVDELTVALQHESEVYTSMLALAKREQQAIVHGDVVTLTRLTEEKEMLLEHLAALETERMTAIVAIAGATGVDASTATVSGLEAVLPLGEGRQLAAAGAELRETALALRAANERNAALLRSSRDIVDRWLQYLRSLLSSVVYDATGRADEVGGRRQLDRSA